LRIPGIIYFSHVATTLVPIVAEFYASNSLTSQQRVLLALVYGTWVVVPLYMLYIFATNPILFSPPPKKLV